MSLFSARIWLTLNTYYIIIIKSQQYIAKQDGQMAAMRKAMVAAGLDPDMVIANDDGMEVDEVDVSTKKRHSIFNPHPLSASGTPSLTPESSPR